MAIVLRVEQGGASSILQTNSPLLSSVSSLPTGGATGQVLTKTSNGDFAVSWQTPSTGGGGGSGTVTSVAGVAPVSGNVPLTKADLALGNVVNLDTSNAANITSGILAIGRIPTGNSSTTVALGNHGHAIADTTGLQTALNAKAASGVNSDITALSALTTPLTALQGGTGTGAYNTGDILYASGAAALSKLSAAATGNALIAGGAGTAPSWGKVGLTTHVTGSLPAANGGTGQTTFTTGDLLFASGSTALSKLPDVATGNALISGGIGAAPSWGKINLGTHTTGTLATSQVVGLDTVISNLQAADLTFAPVVHTHDAADIDSSSGGHLALATMWVGGTVIVDKATGEYGSAGSWPSARPSSRTDIRVIWMGDTDPGSIVFDRDIWYQTA